MTTANTKRTPAAAHRTWRARATRLALCAGVVAAIDCGVALAAGASIGALPALLGVWGTLALLVLPLSGPAQATFGALRVSERLRAGLAAVRGGTDTDSAPAAARLVGWVVAIGLWLGGGLGLLTGFIDAFNTPVLIAAAFMGAQLALIAVAGFVGFGVAHAIRRRGRLTLRRAAAAMLIVGLAGLGVLYATVLKRVPSAGLGPTLAAIAAPLTLWASRRIAGHRAAIGLLLAAPLLAGVALQDAQSRYAVARQAPTAREVVLPLITASDFDRDGVPSLPDLRDCAPFDPDVHPFAADLPGDGIDQNCDGADGGPAARTLVPMPGKLPRTPADIILITVDSLRADHLSIYGYGRPTTPELERLAADAAIFERAWAVDSGTGPSLWSLMAGTAPFEARLNPSRGWPPRFARGQLSLANRLVRAGYRAEAILCGRVFRRVSGIRQGMTSYIELCGADPGALGARITERARQRLERHRKLRGRRGGTAPNFLWVHYYDPHTPYIEHDGIQLPGEDELPDRVRRYDEEIAYTDRQLGELIDHIRAQPGEPWIFLTADHGENFGSHGTAPHARSLYRPVTHVPLLVWGPGVVPRRIEAPVSLVDLHPTMLELARRDPGPSASGRSLLSVLQGGQPDMQRLIYQENSFARPKRHTRAVVGQRYHLITDLTVGHSELYDLEADFDEQHDIYGTGVPDQARLEAALRGFMTLSRIPPAYAR